jgi:hypothetical protein
MHHNKAYKNRSKYDATLFLYAQVMNNLEKSIIQIPEWTNTEIRKNKLMIIDTISKRYISLSDFNRLPQTILPGIIFRIMQKCRTNKERKNYQ